MLNSLSFNLSVLMNSGISILVQLSPNVGSEAELIGVFYL